MEIKLGDIVTLKSDTRHSFTVGNFQPIKSEKHAIVYWFDMSTSDLKSMLIPVIALMAKSTE
jgi:hypothetical protein